MVEVITTTEILLTVIWIVFFLAALVSKEPLIAAISGIVSLIFGLDLGLIFIGDTSEWVFGVVGFAIFLFGFFMMFIALEFSNQKNPKK